MIVADLEQVLADMVRVFNDPGHPVLVGTGEALAQWRALSSRQP
ncbi:hypothetical protein [Amycolatopsis sp. NPDC051128]